MNIDSRDAAVILAGFLGSVLGVIVGRTVEFGPVAVWSFTFLLVCVGLAVALTSRI